MKYWIQGLVFGLLLTILMAGTSFAFSVSTDDLSVDSANDVAEHIVSSSSELPGLITASCYILGIIFGVTGLIKLMDHVTDPRNPLRSAIIRLVAGGFLFVMPIVTQAARNSIGISDSDAYSEGGGAIADLSGSLTVLLGFAGITSINTIVLNILEYSDKLPGLISALAYALGLIMSVSGVIKMKEHVEEPEKVYVKEVVIRFLTAGALFTLPMVYNAMYNTVSGGDMGVTATAMSALYGYGFTYSFFSGDFECVWLDGTLRDVICLSMINSLGIPTLLTAVSYMLGLVFGVWGIIKIRDHVLDPRQTKLNEGVMRFIAGGMFFAIPYIITVINQTVVPLTISSLSVTTDYNTEFNETLDCSQTVNGLDMAMACFMDNIFGPTNVFVNFFGFCAGMILIMIGTSRLIKSAQEGARGPGGIGTIMTFVVGAFLISGGALMQTFGSTMFYSFSTKTEAALSYTGGMGYRETEAIYNVISAVLKFMAIVGLISFIRGLFIVRQMAEGSQQASAMAAFTHIIGGALAVNIGPFINAVQETLGITAFGVTFS